MRGPYQLLRGLVVRMLPQEHIPLCQNLVLVCFLQEAPEAGFPPGRRAGTWPERPA